MKRRDFLNISSKLAAAPLVLNSVPLFAFQPNDLLWAADCPTVHNRAIVLIQMRGGNDGINTVIPIQQYDLYSNLRPDIRIQESSLINLDNTLPLADQVGLHPAMTAIKEMYDDGYVNLIQGTGYENHNRSHFKSTDLFLTGGDSTPDLFNLEEGWMGKYLEYSFSEVIARPDVVMQDPVGLQFGNKKPSLGYHTTGLHDVSISLSGQDPAGFFTLISEVGQQDFLNIPDSHYGEKLEHILTVENDTNVYARRISDVFNAGNNSSSVTYPNTYLANQLKTVARLMNGGCKTKIYLVDMTGFDNHVNQVVSTNTDIGNHANLLAQLSDGVKAFLDDLTAMGIDDRMMVSTFSEFGRTADQNASYGTDHGTISPMFVFGKHVTPGVSGTNVDLSNIVARAPGGFQHDYRRIFTSLVRDWLGASDDVMMATGFYPWIGSALPLVDQSQIANPKCPPLPDEHPSAAYADAGDSHGFSIVIPIENPNAENQPLQELTDCDYVVLKDGFVAEEGINLRVFASVCEDPNPSRLAMEGFGGDTFAIAQPTIEKETAPKREFENFLASNPDLDYVEAFPNPFSSRVTVSFKPAENEQDIQVEILDNSGRRTRIPLVHSYHESSYYSLVFDGSSLPPGPYHVIFTSKKRQKTVKIMKIS